MDKRIFVFDVDDTLAKFRQPMDRHISQGLLALENAGHIVCLASGKSCTNIEGLMRGIGLKSAFAIGENGGVVRDEYSRRPLFTAARPAFFDGLEREISDKFPNAHFQANKVNITVFADDEKTLCDVAQFLTDGGYTKRNDVTVLFHSDAAEVVPNGVSKGSALRLLKKHYGWKTGSMIAIGDGENDISMRSEVDEFFAVGDCIEADINFENTDTLMQYLVERFV